MPAVFRDRGRRVVEPEDVAQAEGSFTGTFLRGVLAAPTAAAA